MSDDAAEHKRRCQQLQHEDNVSSLEEAIDAACGWVEVDKRSTREYQLVAQALTRLHRYEDCDVVQERFAALVSQHLQKFIDDFDTIIFLTTYTGLEVYPDSEELQQGLKEARVAVLNDLLEESEEEEDELVTGGQLSNADAGEGYIDSLRDTQRKEDGPLRSTQIVQRAQTYAASGLNEMSTNEPKDNTVLGGGETQATVFQAKMERVLEHLDVLKLARLAALYIVNELLNLRRVTFGMGLLFFGLLAQAIMHRQKLMVVSMLVICLCRSQLKERALPYAHDWVQTSTDKLGAFAWAPRIIFVIPVFMKVFGQLKFMLFLQQDVHLAGIIFAVTAVLAANALRADAGPQAKLWGEGRRLKFAAYFSTIVYWVGWRGQVGDTIRLLGPAFIDAAGIVLGSVSSSELQEVCRRAFTRLYSEVANDIQADVDLDAWFFLCLGNWVVEYWQQPTDFSLEVLSKMLSECFDSMEKAAVRTFSPELSHLRKQLIDMEITDELRLLVAYLKQSLRAVPPSQSFGMIALFSKRCSSFVVFGVLVVFYGVISLPLLPFIASEYHEARYLYNQYRGGKLHEMDGLELMLLGSPLFRVWKNAKGCIYCLEGSVTFSKAVATGTHMVSAAARISQLAVFASRVKKEGVFANAHDISDHIANAFLVTKDSSLIIDGVRYIRESAQFQDLTASIANWWHGGGYDKATSSSRQQQEEG